MREQRKVVTVLFCDLVGSTALGESTDPEALRARMRSYFADLRAILERHGGSVEKFVGDAVMAVFGIPTAHEDDAFRALRAAVEMRHAIAAHGLEARIGVNTGEVVVGGEGDTLVTGDAVNVAARLEQAAPSGEILIGADTRSLARDAVRTEALEPLELKGKSRPVEAYRLLDVVEDAAAIERNLGAPLVGRERERQRLWTAFEDAVADRTCQLFTLLGPAGIGKSRLVADFLERVGSQVDVMRGRCLSYGEGITYWPLVEMLVPLGVDPDDVVASTPAETRVAFRKLLEARSIERPQVVLIDDLQWAEPEFVDLVEHVADLSRDAPIFLLCVARTELLDARPDWGGGKLNATSLLLEPLGAGDCEALIDNLLGERELAVDARERIMLASGGNALFVEEMVAMVRESGDGADLAVPPTISTLLQARIDALAKERRAELHERCAGGLEERSPALHEIDEIVGYHLEQALFLRLELGTRDDQLAARAAARLLAAGTRALGRTDHPAAAGLLQRAVDVRGDDRTHLVATYQLARVCLRRGEHERAGSQLQAAIELASAIGDQGILARAQLSHNSLRIRVDSDQTVEPTLAQALQIAESLEGTGELAALVHAYVEIGTCRFQLGRAGEGELDLERAGELAREMGDDALFREVMMARLRPAGWGPLPASDGVALCEGLIARDDNPALKAHALQILALFRAMLGDVEASRQAATEAWALLDEFDFRRHKGLYAGDIGVSELIGRDLDRAEFELRRGHDVLVAMGDVGVRSTIDAVLADVLFLQGKHDEALELADSSRAISTVDDLDAQPRWRASRARVLSARGEHDEALTLLGEAVDLVEPIDFLELKGFVHDVLGEALARVGRPDDAVRALERAVGYHEAKGNIVSAARTRSVLDDLRSGPPS